MKDGIREIVGKTIAAVVLNERFPCCTPTRQIFLVFTDGTHYEIYGDQVWTTGGVDAGGFEAAVKYAKGFQGGAIRVFREPD